MPFWVAELLIQMMSSLEPWTVHHGKKSSLLETFSRI